MNTLARSAVPALGRRFCSMHSSDIAFKPNEDGWGYNKNYGSNFDKIFGSKTQAPKSEEADVEKKAAKAETQAASN